MIDPENVLSHKFYGINADQLLSKGNDISEEELFAFRAGWNEALEIVASEECDRWIDVLEEPDEGEFVLVAWVPANYPMPPKIKHFYGCSEYTNGKYEHYFKSNFKDIKVLAWMPLPKEYEA